MLTNILDHAWAGGRDLSLADLIRQIQAPPFESLGVLDLESVFPQRDRGKLAATLNGLLASPTAAAKLAGEPLDIARLLYTETGKPRVSIVSIAHLSDAERMSFVTLLLGEFLTWTRSQAGTSSLRALLYMDEIFGFVPPVANPPSKQPLLTLLKQARAFGVGVMLATQNPVDLDYRGLSNIGTWFLGRLQTERDKARVLDGLEGAAGESGTKFDRARVEQTLSTLGKRMFLAQNVHEDGPVLFQTRWALSYLRGPLTRSQIAKLMADRKAAAAGEKRVTKASKSVPVEAEAGQGGSPPAIDSKIPVAAIGPIDERRVLQPALFGTARVHFRRTTYGVDLTRNVALVVPLDGEPPGHLWEPAEPVDDDTIDLSPELSDDARYGDVPSGLFTARGLKSAASKFKDHVYRSEAVTVRSCKALKLLSEPDEPEADFRVRITQAAREARDLAVEKIRARYATKVKSLERRKRTAEERVDREKAEADRATYSAALSFGSSLMSALFGRKLASRGNVSRASSSMRSAGSAAKQRSDVARAEEKLEDVVRDIEELEAELDDVIEAERDKFAADRLEIEEVRVNATKTNITVGRVGLA
ncbi:MAG: ATP-binding protein, partial [Planctomycetota bacterium]